MESGAESLVSNQLRQLYPQLGNLRFPLVAPDAELGADLVLDVRHQLEDYILPRFAALDAPLLAVIGGSTGSGKSTLINSLAGAELSVASAIRPTTRRPLLIFHPEEESWFTSTRILPELARVTTTGTAEAAEIRSDTADTTQLELRAATAVPRGLALLDSPDIDSIVEENRRLAAQLLAAADLWIFVTTAARYADAIPWAMLDAAAARNVVIGVVLNRVPPGVGAQVRADLVDKFAQRGLSHAPLFVISEQDLGADHLLPEPDVAPLRDWLQGLTADAAARATVVRQSLLGAVGQLEDTLGQISAAYQQQLIAKAGYAEDLTKFATAEAEVLEQLSDGSLLRGEVLARWQDVVGTGQWTRMLESGISRLRDRITGFFRARNLPTEPVAEAIEESLHTLLVAEAQSAIVEALQAWESRPGGEKLASAVRQNLRSSSVRAEVAAELIRQWQKYLLEIVRTEGQDKKTMARALALGVNVVGVALMIAVFSVTGGLAGGEVAVASGTAVVAQRVLEALFGDSAVRRMASQARNDLAQRVQQFLAADQQVFAQQLEQLELSSAQAEEFAAGIAGLAAASRAEQDK
ncbi:MAG: dynamin family protein [Trueperella sp.]|nr:dynamin family protein [Trueperella sp.]